MSGLLTKDPDEPGPAWPSCTFWDWAVAAYARPGVADACLELQDQDGYDVVLVLFALWLAERGTEVDGRLADRAWTVSESWHADVVGPLRALRRRLKQRLAEPLHPDAPEVRQRAHVSALRARIKALELASERLQILALAELAPDLPGTAATGAELARANLSALLGPAATDRPALSRLIELIALPASGQRPA